MGESLARHRFGNYALIFAILAIAFAGFSSGAVWATSDGEVSTTIQDSWGDDVDIDAIVENDIYLREMETKIEGSVTFIFFISEESEELDSSETKTYVELSQNSSKLGSSTFKEMDTAGAVAEWMIWIGIGTTLITAIICLCSLAQITSSRPLIISGTISSILLFFTPIVWFILLPSDSSYSNIDVLGSASTLFSEDPNLPIDLTPNPSIGVFLSIIGGVCAASMMVMIVLYNRSEPTKKKPGWMITDDFTILPEPTLLNLISRDDDSINLNFSELKSQPKRMIMPAIQVLMIILFSITISGTWASYSVDFSNLGLGDESLDLSFSEEGAMVGEGGGMVTVSYGEDIDSSWKEMGEVIEQSSTIGSISKWMMILSLIWRFSVSTGNAQKIPSLCQHHRIIDTSLLTGGSFLAFTSLLFFIIQSPSKAELFGDGMPEEIIDGGTSFLILLLMVLLVPFTIIVFTLGEHGASVRKFLQYYGVTIPIEVKDDSTVSLVSESEDLFLQNPLSNLTIDSIPWVSIGVVTLVLLSLSGGGYLAYKIANDSDDSEGLQTNILYDLNYSITSGQYPSEIINVPGGQEILWTFNQDSAPNGSSLFGIFITFDYDESDADPLCDVLNVEVRSSPGSYDSPNSTSQGSASDCGGVYLELFAEHGRECSGLSGSNMSLNSDQADSLRSYCNEHEGGVGIWEFSISIDDVGGPLENGEEVFIIVDYAFGSLSLEESI
jgi:hypothetical protein